MKPCRRPGRPRARRLEVCKIIGERPKRQQEPEGKRMLTIYDTTGNSLLRHNETAPITKDTVWFDLLNPTKEEDNQVEGLLKISVPTRAEMREIEASSRFYQENGASYMTASCCTTSRRQGRFVHRHVHSHRQRAGHRALRRSQGVSDDAAARRAWRCLMPIGGRHHDRPHRDAHRAQG